MSDIKIEKTEGGYKATNGDCVAWSPDGARWYSNNGTGVGGSAYRAIFISQYIDPTKPQPEPPFKVGDEVVCVDACKYAYRLTVGKTYTITQLADTYMYVIDDRGFNYSRFTLAPKPKVYTGNPKEWGEGVYRELGSTNPYLVLVGEHLKWRAVANNLRTISERDYSFGQDFIKIANTISEVFVPGLMEREGIV